MTGISHLQFSSTERVTGDVTAVTIDTQECHGRDTRFIANTKYVTAVTIAYTGLSHPVSRA